jgi:hypothetical protein
MSDEGDTSEEHPINARFLDITHVDPVSLDEIIMSNILFMGRWGPYAGGPPELGRTLAIPVLEAPIDPGARPRRLGVSGVNYSESDQAQRYDTTMYEIQRSRKRRRDVEEGPLNVGKR